MRHDSIIRCFQVIEALKRKGGISAPELADALGFHVRTAYRYITAASLVLPVMEHGGTPAKFELIEPKGNVKGRREITRIPRYSREFGRAFGDYVG